MSRKNREALRDGLGDAMRTHQAAVDAFDEAVADHLGVNRTDLRCLDVLLRLGAATPGQLGTELGLTTGSVTALLDRLEKLGYLGRSPDPTDRRRLIVRPSATAGRLAGELYGPLAEAGARAAARYTVAELELLIDFLGQSRQLQEEHLARVRAMPSPHRGRPPQQRGS
jgi:DNA-binding MarR family transcriptional regulator